MEVPSLRTLAQSDLEETMSGKNENIITDLPLHTNKAIAIQKEKRKRISDKSQKAIDSGNVQSVIDSLSERQRRFCEEYLVDLNATQAITRSGYNTKYPNRVAFQLMENPAVRIAIDALRAQRSKATDVTKDFVLQGITKAIRKAEESGNHNAVLRGYELLARHLQMFIERTEISGPDGNAIELKKIEEDVADFTSAITRIAERRGTGA
jgi:phage terminase small subunit